MNNRDRLCRTRDGRFRAGVFIGRDTRGCFCAEVLVALKGVGQEIVTASAQCLQSQATFEDAAKEAREWALEHLPRIFEFDAQDLAVELLRDTAVFT